MSDEKDPLDFIKNMWGSMGFTLPGMVTPTVDTDELDKRIADLKAVEGWLKTNLGLLQMTIHGLEMQRTTLAAMQAIGKSANNTGENPNPFANPALWQWPFMPQAPGQEEASQPAAEAGKPAEPPPARSRAKKKSS